MQPNDLSNVFIEIFYNALNECISIGFNKFEEQEIIGDYYPIYYETWELIAKKYVREIECEINYYPEDDTLYLVLKTNRWYIHYSFIFNEIKIYIQRKSQEDIENKLRLLISNLINTIESCFFEIEANKKELKKLVIDDIKSSYTFTNTNSDKEANGQVMLFSGSLHPILNFRRIFDYGNDCFLEAIHTQFNLLIQLCNKNFVIGFITPDGTSAFTPFIGEETLFQHEILINQGYNKLISDLTINYKNINRNDGRIVDYKNDEYVLSWFKSQISNDGLSNIFSDISTHLEMSAQPERALNLIKGILQDLNKIFYSIENIYYLEDLSKIDSEKEFLLFQPIQNRKSIYQGIDIEFIIIKYRSILDYSLELIKEVFPDTEGNKLQGKFEYFSDVMKNNSNFDKIIMSSNWFQAMKNIRDNVIHHGATCLIFNGDNLGFQVYDLELDKLVYFDDDYMKLNENVVRVDRFLIINLSYLYYFLNTCFTAINKKIVKQYSSDKKETIVRHIKEAEDFSQYAKEHLNINRGIFNIPNSSLILKWCDDLLNEFENL